MSLLTRLVAFAFALTLAAALPSLSARSERADLKTYDDAILQLSELARVAKYGEALTIAEAQAREIAAALGERTTQYARAIGWQAYLLQQTGRFSEARPQFEKSLEIYEALLPAGHPDIATAMNNLGFHYQLTDRLGEAETLYKRSLQMREDAKPQDKRLVSDSLNNLAQVYKHQGRTLEAIPLLERSLSIRLKILKPQDPLIAQSLTNIGAALERIGRFKEAEPYLKKAHAIRVAAQAPEHPDVVGAMNKLAQNLSSQEKYDEAERLFAKTLALLEKTQSGDRPDVANTLHDRAQNLYALKRYTDAEALLRRSATMRKHMLPENHPSIAHTLGDLAATLLEQGRLDEALAAIREGVLALVARGKSDALGKLRFLEFVRIAWQVEEARKAKGLRAEADPLANEAFLYAQRATDTPTANAVARMSARFAASNPALKTLIDERDDIEAQQLQLENDMSAALARTGSDRSERVEKLRQEIANAGTRLAASDDRLKREFPEYFDLVKPDPLDIEDVRSLLQPNEVLLEYVTTAREVYVWAVSQKAGAWRKLDIDPTTLAENIGRLRGALDVEAIGRAGVGAKLFELGLAHQLYLDLLAPVSEVVPEGAELIVVANGALTGLPMQMLVKSKPEIERPKLTDLAAYRTADWVARHHSVSVLPSVVSLEALRKVSGDSASPRPMVGFGNPIFASSGTAALQNAATKAKRVDGYASFWRGPAANLSALRSGLAELPETEAELRSIAAALKAQDGDIFLGRAASETAVKQAPLSDYRVVYFATHGLVAGEVEGLGEPALVFSLPDEPSERDDGLLTASEVTQLHLDADWVVLSACNTAAGQKPGAEALSGLARAFFHAGTRAMLVSHWKVGSQATATLTTHAFQALSGAPTIGRAEAVRRAMVQLVEDRSDPWNAYPTFWAAFSVVGEGAKTRAKS